MKKLDFNPQESFKTVAIFNSMSGESLKSRYLKSVIKDDSFDSFLNCFLNQILQLIQFQNQLKKPTPPFTTSTLQQEASRKLGFSVSELCQPLKNYMSKDISPM